MNKRILTVLFVLHFSILPVLADYFDLSVDDEIRKNYNPNQLEIDTGLPALPKVKDIDNNNYVNDDAVIPTTKSGKLFNSSINYKKNIEISDSAQTSYARMKKGKIIKLKTKCKISDKMKKGTRLSFVSTYPVSTTYFTIPGGTQFTGEIVDVHRPQFTGNGGLIVIKINSVLFNNEVLPINATVKKISTNNDSKHIFCNNIKGKRKYLSNTVKSTTPGTKFCKKMYSISSKFWQKGGLNMLISPLTAVTGTAAWAGNVVASPIIAVFTKGNSIIIPKGSILEVKLIDDMYIYK